MKIYLQLLLLLIITSHCSVADVITIPRSKRIRPVNYQTITPIWELKTISKDDVVSLAFSGDNSLLAGGNRRNIELWNPQTGDSLGTLQGHTEWVTTIAFSSDDKLLVSGSSDSTVRLWNIKDKSCIATLEGHKGAVTFLMFAPNGKHLLSSGTDLTIKLWDLETKKLVHNFTGLTYPVFAAKLSDDATKLVTLGAPLISSGGVAVRPSDEFKGNPMARSFGLGKLAMGYPK